MTAGSADWGAYKEISLAEKTMKTRFIAMVIIVLGIFWASITEGQALRDVFKRVNSSVVVIRAVETNVIAEPGFL